VLVPRERGMFVWDAKRILAESMASLVADFVRGSITGKLLLEEKRRIAVRPWFDRLRKCT